MNIIHITLAKGNIDRLNGVNKVAHQIAAKQAACARNVGVWSFSRTKERHGEVRPYETKYFTSRADHFEVERAFEDSLSSLNPETMIFHIHGAWVPLFYTIQKILKRKKFNYIFTAHGAYHPIAALKKPLFQWLYNKFIEKYVVKNASIVHCFGDEEHTYINKMYDQAKIVTIPFGIKPYLGAEVQQHVDQNKINLGFVGKIDYYIKGLDVMMDAMSIVIQSKKNIYLSIIGSGEGNEELARKILKSGLEKHVSMEGAVFNDHKTQLMNQMDVFINVSRYEVIPMAVMEAASMGIPCIISKATNICKVVEKHHAGLVVQNENAQSLADAIIRFSELSFSVRQQMRSNAREMCNTTFHWPHIVDQLDEMYYNVK